MLPLTVAVKSLNPGSGDRAELLKEAALQAMLEHPNLLGIVGVVRLSPTLFVMPELTLENGGDPLPTRARINIHTYLHSIDAHSDIGNATHALPHLKGNGATQHAVIAASRVLRERHIA